MAPPTGSISIARLIQWMLELMVGHFYGTVLITFRAGQIKTVEHKDVYMTDDELPVKDLQAVELMQTGQIKIAS